MIIFTELSQLFVSTCKSISSPVNELVTYGFPLLGARRSQAHEVTDKSDKDDPKALLFYKDRAPILKEIKALEKIVGLRRSVTPYYSLDDEFKHFGGRWSFTRPIVYIPLQHLQRKVEFGPFGQEKNGEALKKETSYFTDLETKFLITKQLIGIKQNDSLLKTAARVAIFAALILAIKIPVLGLIASLPLFVFASLFFFLVERLTQEWSDGLAIDALSKTIDRSKVVDAAKNALEKQRQQNLHTRTKTLLGKFWITKEGNERWNFSAPSLTKRIKRIEKIVLLNLSPLLQPCMSLLENA